MDLKATYNAIGDAWFRHHGPDSWWPEGAARFSAFLPKGGSVLDVGSGGGTAAQYFVDKGFALTGIDFSEKMVEIATREVPRATFVVMDIRDVTSLGRQFDGLYAKASLLHFPKKEIPAIMEKLQHMLKPGGYIYIAVKGLRPGKPEEEIKVETDFGMTFERFFSFFTLPEVEKYCTDCGLEICHTRVSDSGRAQWVEVIARKTQ